MDRCGATFRPLMAAALFAALAVPMTFPDPVEIPDAVLTEADKEALAKAEEKRLRKQKKHEQPKPTQAAA